MKQIKTKIKIAVLVIMGMSLGVNAQTKVVSLEGANDPNFVNKNGNVGIGTDNPDSKLDVHGNIYMQNNANRGSSHFKIFRGKEGRDAATISFGENGNQNWFLGHLYYGGNTSPDLYISKKSAIYDGNGSFVHTPEFTIRSNSNVGIGTATPQAKLDVHGNIYMQNNANRGSSHFKIYRGKEGKDAATISFGENGNQNWFLGHLYYGGSPSPDLYISKKSAIYDGNGSLVHAPEFTIRSNGNVGIGTKTPDMKLAVNGKIHAKEVKIDLAVPAPDYVFKSEYKLRSIEEVESFIKEHSHLPEIPSAKEFAENGVMQAQMDMNLLKKIEELTLYTINQEKKLKTQNSKIEKQQTEIEELKKQNSRIKDLEILVQKLLKDKN